MSTLDDLRWMWASRISQDLVSWAGLWARSEMELAPGVRAPLSLAWLVARAARVLADREHHDPTEPLVSAIPFDDGWPSAGEIVQRVQVAMVSSPWPDEVPADPRAAELLLSELWSAARSRELHPMALHRELAQRWEIRDPRMLKYLSGLPSSPFDAYTDFLDVLLGDADSEATRLLMFMWNKLAPESDGEAYPGMPAHLTGLAAATYTALRVEHNIKKYGPGWASELQAPAEGALQMLRAHRSHMADVMNDLSGHEVEIVRSAVFGDEAA
jgi:hypothetical protein